MGLAFSFGEERVSCAYTTVHALRRRAITAAMAASDNLRSHLEDWVDEDAKDGTGVNYDLLPEYRNLSLYNLPEPDRRLLAGLHKFVSHSDCDGFHSPGDAADIAFCLERTRLHWQGGDAEPEEWLPRLLTQLLEQFTAAAQRGTSVLYY